MKESYASICTNKRQQSDVKSFRSILEEAKFEQITEEQEQERRRTNLIIHGADESSKMDAKKLKQIDEDYVSQLLNNINLDTKPKYVSRIGRTSPGKKRPIKVVLNSAHQVAVVQKNLKLLKDKEKYQGISITEDYTEMERRMIKSWVEKVEMKNKEEKHGSNVTWKLRGTPREGFWIKKIIENNKNITNVNKM